jgi:MFS family permease
MTAAARMRRSWAAIPHPARTVLAADLLSNTGTGLVLAFTAIYVAHIHHHGPAAGALAVAAVAAGSLPANAVAGRAADRHGAAAVLAWGWVLAACGDGALIVASGTAALLAACLVVGAGVGTAYPTLNALLGELTDGDTRRLVFGAQHGLANLGFSLGALGAAAIVARATPGRFDLLYALDAASFLAAAALIATHARRPRPAPSQAPPRPAPAHSYRQVLGDRRFRRLCAISGLIVVFGYSQFHAALPLVLSRPGGLTPGAIAVVFAANTLTVAAAAVPVATLTRRAGRPQLMAAGAACFAACWALLAASGHTGTFPGPLLLAIAAAAVMGIGETLLSPSLGPTVNELAPTALRGRYNAADSLVYSVGSLFGPILAGLLTSNTGSTGLLATLILGCLAAAAVAGSWTKLQAVTTAYAPPKDGPASWPPPPAAPPPSRRPTRPAPRHATLTNAAGPDRMN